MKPPAFDPAANSPCAYYICAFLCLILSELKVINERDGFALAWSLCGLLFILAGVITAWRNAR